LLGTEYDKNQLYGICFDCGKENTECSIAIWWYIVERFCCYLIVWINSSMQLLFGNLGFVVDLISWSNPKRS
jgi:hypothetical protein